MLKMIKFFIHLGKVMALKELDGCVNSAENIAFNLYIHADPEEPNTISFNKGKVNAYIDVLETIKMILEKEEHGYKKEKW